MNENEKFLQDLENDQNQGDVDILNQPLEPEVAKPKDDEKPENEGDENEDEGDLKPRNRRERRLMRKLTSERESSIFLAGKLEARSEAEKSVTEEADYLKSVERIYGNETPENQLAGELLKKAIVGARDDAENRAYNRIKSEQQQQVEEQRKAEGILDGFIEDIEDTYDVSMTEAMETSYFKLLQKMSPKDSQGNVTGYADPHAVWEVFQDKLKSKGTNNRSKELSNRSMTQSGTQQQSTLQNDTDAKFLRENGIF